MPLAYLLAVGFALFLAAGWHRLFTEFTPRPGSARWYRANACFAMVALFTALAHLRANRTPEAAATLFLGLVVTGLGVYAGMRYRHLPTNS